MKIERGMTYVAWLKPELYNSFHTLSRNKNKGLFVYNDPLITPNPYHAKINFTPVKFALGQGPTPRRRTIGSYARFDGQEIIRRNNDCSDKNG